MKKLMLLLVLLCIYCSSAMAMNFIDVRYMGSYTCNLTRNGLIYSAKGYNKDNNRGFLFGNIEDGVFISKNYSISQSGIYSKGKIAYGIFAGENSKIYKVITDSGMSIYINVEQSHGDLLIDVIANNGGNLVKYISNSTVSDYLKGNYGDMFAMHSSVDGIYAYENKIFVDLSYRVLPPKKSRIVFFWDDKANWFGIDKCLALE